MAWVGQEILYRHWIRIALRCVAWPHIELFIAIVWLSATTRGFSIDVERAYSINSINWSDLMTTAKVKRTKQTISVGCIFYSIYRIDKSYEMAVSYTQTCGFVLISHYTCNCM